MSAGEEVGAGEYAESAVIPLQFDDGGQAFLEAIRQKGREYAALGQPMSYYHALFEAVNRLLVAGYGLGEERYIDGICTMANIMLNDGGENALFAMMIETITEPKDMATA